MKRSSLVLVACLALVQYGLCSFQVSVTETVSSEEGVNKLPLFTVQGSLGGAKTGPTSFKEVAETVDFQSFSEDTKALFLNGLAQEDGVFQGDQKLPSLEELVGSCKNPSYSVAEDDHRIKSILSKMFLRGTDKKTVHKLHPRDIKVVMALGDSITAGFGVRASPLLTGLLEYRGLSFSMGGDKDAVSFPNILDKSTKSAVKGRSSGWALPLDAFAIRNRLIRPHNPDTDVLNAAQSGATSDLLDKQIDYLVEETSKRGIDVKNEWKVISLFMGANNLCRVCEHPTVDTAVDVYRREVSAALRKIHEKFPKTFVNLVQPLDVAQVHDFMAGSTYCKYVWSIFGECACILGSGASDNTRAQARDMHDKINTFLEQESERWKAKRLDDFAVITQPFFSGARITDENQLSRIDCFHPSELTQGALGVNLWNAMLTPKKDKVKAMDSNIPKPICIDDNTILRTD